MKLVILDRDGVINEDSESFIKTPEEWIPIQGSLEAISRLNESGYRVVVASNQSGVGRGLLNIETLNSIHEKMKNMLAEVGGHIDAIYFCPHKPSDGCDCRKPLPGLFTKIAGHLRTSLTDVVAIGDSPRDIEAAIAAGASPVLVYSGKTRADNSNEKLIGIPAFDNLAGAVDDLLENDSSI
jgi:D-glycero-D-manno-heptose 1,7-bisphosphate phosphatase